MLERLRATALFNVKKQVLDSTDLGQGIGFGELCSVPVVWFSGRALSLIQGSKNHSQLKRNKCSVQVRRNHSFKSLSSRQTEEQGDIET